MNSVVFSDSVVFHPPPGCEVIHNQHHQYEVALPHPGFPIRLLVPALCLTAKTWSSGPSAVRWVRTIDHGDTETVTLRDVTPKSASPTRLIRLRVLKLDGF